MDFRCDRRLQSEPLVIPESLLVCCSDGLADRDEIKLEPGLNMMFAH